MKHLFGFDNSVKREMSLNIERMKEVTIFVSLLLVSDQIMDSCCNDDFVS